MKQNFGSKNCLAVVASMAFKEDLNFVQQFFNTDENTEASVSDFVKFADVKGFYVGHIFQKPKVFFDRIVETYVVKDNPALALVESEYNPGQQHAIYWDGRQVWDPNPGVIDGRALKEYDIIAWLPIIKID
jgi:hypothetical protein